MLEEATAYTRRHHCAVMHRETLFHGRWCMVFVALWMMMKICSANEQNGALIVAGKQTGVTPESAADLGMAFMLWFLMENVKTEMGNVAVLAREDMMVFFYSSVTLYLCLPFKHNLFEKDRRNVWDVFLCSQIRWLITFRRSGTQIQWGSVYNPIQSSW